MIEVDDLDIMACNDHGAAARLAGLRAGRERSVPYRRPSRQPSIAKGFGALDAGRRRDGIVISFVGIRMAARHFPSGRGNADTRS